MQSYFHPDAGGEVPAAALTAFAHSEDRARAAREGYQTHLAKPVRPPELVSIVASLHSLGSSRHPISGLRDG